MLTLDCTYKKLKNIVKETGITIINQNNGYKNSQDCENKCHGTQGCQNFDYCPDSFECYPHDKQLTGLELQTEEHGTCFTSYKSCNPGNAIEHYLCHFFLILFWQ